MRSVDATNDAIYGIHCSRTSDAVADGFDFDFLPLRKMKSTAFLMSEPLPFFSFLLLNDERCENVVASVISAWHFYESSVAVAAVRCDRCTLAYAQIELILQIIIIMK